MTEMIFAGFGGQGVLTAGLIVAKTGMRNGDNVTWIPSYGSEMRGGTANCNVKISSSNIPTPFVKNVDVLLAMNIPSIDKFMPMMRAGATLIYNKSLIKDVKFRDDINIFGVEASEIAESNSNLKGSNIVMLGALASSGILYDKAVMLEGMEEFFISKGKNNPKNSICFEKGFESTEKVQ